MSTEVVLWASGEVVGRSPFAWLLVEATSGYQGRG